MRLTTVCFSYWFYSIALIGFSIHSYSQDFKPGSRNASLCNSTVASTDPWSLFQNQAGLAWQDKFWVGLHHENKFLIKDLGYSAVGVNIPVKPGTFGLSSSHFGNKQYNLYKVSIGYGMKLTNNLAAGIGINYHNLSITNNYGSTDLLTVEGGVIYVPNDKVAIGAHVFNPNGTASSSVIIIPTSFGLGLSYTPSKRLLITIQADDSSIGSPVFRSGVEFLPSSNFSVRTGFSTNPACLSFGIGLEIAKIELDIAFSYHEILGYTPHISVSYSF